MKLLTSAWTKIAAATALALSAAAVQAETYTFTLTGDYAATWTVDSSPMVDDYADEIGFVLWDVEGNFPGSLLGMADLTFWHDSIGGGISIDDYYGDTTLMIADGPQLYTGTEDAPTFTLGTYALTEYEGTGTYTLTVSAVPEPAALALMLAGLGVVGVAAARRKAAATV